MDNIINKLGSACRGHGQREEDPVGFPELVMSFCWQQSLEQLHALADRSEYTEMSMSVMRQQQSLFPRIVPLFQDTRCGLC